MSKRFVLWRRCQLRKNNFYKIEVNNVSLLLWTNSLGFGILQEPRLTCTVAQKTRYPAVKNSWIINTFNIHYNDHWTSGDVFLHFELSSERQNCVVLNVRRFIAYSLNNVEVNRELRRFQDRTSSLPIQHRVPFWREINTTCNRCHATKVLHRILSNSQWRTFVTERQVLCSYLRYFAEAIVEAWSLKIACYFYTDISADSNGILVEKREEFQTAGYAVFIVPVSHTNFVQFVQNQ